MSVRLVISICRQVVIRTETRSMVRVGTHATSVSHKSTYLESREKVKGSCDTVANNTDEEEQRLKDEEDHTRYRCQDVEDCKGKVVDEGVDWINNPI